LARNNPDHFASVGWPLPNPEGIGCKLLGVDQRLHWLPDQDLNLIASGTPQVDYG
jgi:hypothetical protein